MPPLTSTTSTTPTWGSATSHSTRSGVISALVSTILSCSLTLVTTLATTDPLPPFQLKPSHLHLVCKAVKLTAKSWSCLNIWKKGILSLLAGQWTIFSVHSPQGSQIQRKFYYCLDDSQVGFFPNAISGDLGSFYRIRVKWQAPHPNIPNMVQYFHLEICQCQWGISQ